MLNELKAKSVTPCKIWRSLVLNCVETWPQKQWRIYPGKKGSVAEGQLVISLCSTKHIFS